MNRAQSDSIGVILLVAVISLTITTTGVVVLTEWQSGIDQGPVASIDSEITPINVTLGHRGGDVLYPQNTTIHLIGADEEISLDEPLEPGTSLSREFDRLDGTIELLVVYDPRESVIYRDTHRIHNPVEGLSFAVDDRTEPAYVLEGYPANYTVDEVFELGISDPVTRAANVTVADESQLAVDEGATTIEGLNAGVSVNATAAVDNRTAETEIIVLESDPPLEVKIDTANVTGITSATFTGELVDLGGLPEAELSFNYYPSRIFNGNATNNGDQVVADGEYYAGGYEGYAHDNDYVHDNVPLQAGETRAYVYDKRGSGAEYRWYFRDEPQLEPTGGLSNRVHVGGDTRNLPADQYRIEVTLSDDGSTADVVLYTEPEGGNIVTAERGISVGSYPELYFSSYEYSGTSGSSSLRLIGIDVPTELETVEVETGVDTPHPYTTTYSEIEPKRDYAVVANAQQDIGSQLVQSSSDPIEFRISGPTVDTLNTTRTGARSVEATGELVDMGDLEATDLFFEYFPSRIFNKNATNNGDWVVADGDYYVGGDEGYAHDNDYVHDNVPLEAGETRRYVYDKRESGAEYRWYFRDEPQPDPTGGLSNRVHVGGDTRNLPADQYRIEVTLSDDGSTADVVLYTEPEGGNIVTAERGISVGSYPELYFSSYEYSGRSGSSSLRLLGIDVPSRLETVEAETGVTEPTEYSGELTGLELDRDYAVRAQSKRDSIDPPVTSAGDVITFSTNSPTVETRSVTAAGARAVNATGAVVDLGGLRGADLSFNYWPSRIFNERSTNDSDGVLADGDFWKGPDGYAHDNDYVHDNRPLEAGETRTYIYDKRGSGAEYRWYFRDDLQPDATGGISNRVHVGGDTRNLPADQYRIEVTLSDDGSSADVALYNEPEGGTLVTAERDIGVGGYSELYFSSYEYSGSSGSSSLRLLGIETFSATKQAVAETDTNETGPFSTEISGLELEREYAIEASVGNESVDPPVTASGEPISYATNRPTVETRSVRAAGARAVDATGAVVDLGGLRRANLSFEYWPSRIFNEQSTNDSDGVFADGDFWEGPDGYAHDNDYVHDNRPLEAGETRTYIYDKRGSGAEYRWYFRDDLQPDATGGISNRVHVGGDTRNLPADQYRIEVTLSDDGSSADVILYNEPEGGKIVTAERGIDVGSHAELYFSSYEYSGSSGSSSLRLLGIETFSATEQAIAETDTNKTGLFSTEISGLELDREYAIEAVVENNSIDPPVNGSGTSIRYATEQPAVDTLAVSASGARALNATGELIDLNGLRRANLSFNYWPTRIFNERSTNNSDGVLADGDYWTDPGGYAHDNDYVHDNRPLKAGETRTYVFDKRGSGAEYRWYFRDDLQSDATGGLSNRVHVGGDTRNLPADRYRIEVTLSDDASTADVVLYNEPEGGNVVTAERGIGVGSYSELYFSSYEYSGSSGSSSLRLLGIETYSAIEQAVAETDSNELGIFSTEITGLEVERAYAIAAYVENTTVDPPVNATGKPIRFQTERQTVETLDVTTAGTATLDATGELVDLGGVDSTDAYFEYWPSRIFNEQPTNNSDSVLADGDFWESPDGYAHDNDYVHDNRPLEAGETRTYVFDKRGSGAEYRWYFRDAEQPDATGGISNRVHVGGDTRNLPADQYRIEVTLSDDGSSADVALYNEPEGGTLVTAERGISVGSYPELYFSSYEYSGSSGSSSLRLLGIETFSSTERIEAESDLTTPTTYSDTITGLETNREYAVTAFVETDSVDPPVNATGDWIRVTTTG